MARRILAVVPDLFFATRILATARTLAVPLDLTPIGRAAEACATTLPELVILDLHAAGDPHALIRALKADERTAGIPIIGFYSHVDTALRRSALEAGIDQAMPRSTFTARLPELIAGSPLPAPAQPGDDE